MEGVLSQVYFMQFRNLARVDQQVGLGPPLMQLDDKVSAPGENTRLGGGLRQGGRKLRQSFGR